MPKAKLILAKPHTQTQDEFNLLQVSKMIVFILYVKTHKKTSKLRGTRSKPHFSTSTGQIQRVNIRPLYWLGVYFVRDREQRVLHQCVPGNYLTFTKIIAINCYKLYDLCIEMKRSNAGTCISVCVCVWFSWNCVASGSIRQSPVRLCFPKPNVKYFESNHATPLWLMNNTLNYQQYKLTEEKRNKSTFFQYKVFR